MKAKTSYTDFYGTVAADISNQIGIKFGRNDLSSIGKYFRIDDEKYEVVGIKIYGTKSFSISLICKDLKKSSGEKSHIILIRIDTIDNKEALVLLFKELRIIISEKNSHQNDIYEAMDELNLSELNDPT